jgi:hypothetical protein
VTVKNPVISGNSSPTFSYDFDVLLLLLLLLLVVVVVVAEE